jgi:hypothetical protein
VLSAFSALPDQLQVRTAGIWACGVEAIALEAIAIEL